MAEPSIASLILVVKFRQALGYFIAKLQLLSAGTSSRSGTWSSSSRALRSATIGAKPAGACWFKPFAPQAGICCWFRKTPTSCESIASSNPRPSRKRKLPPKPQTSAIRMCRRFSIVEKCGDQVCASWVDGGAEGTLTVRGFEGRDPSSGVGDDQRHCVHEDLFLLIEPMPMLTLMQALSCLSLVEPSFSQP